MLRFHILIARWEFERSGFAIAKPFFVFRLSKTVGIEEKINALRFMLLAFAKCCFANLKSTIKHMLYIPFFCIAKSVRKM